MSRTGKLLIALAMFMVFGLASAPSAQAGHIFFGNLRANGVDLFVNPGHLFTASTLLFETDITGCCGTAGDLINFSFSGLGDVPANFSAGTGTATVSFTRSFSSSFNGSVLVDIPNSSPDFATTNGESFTFLFNVRPTATAAVPEPATMILLGTGLAGIAAKVRRRRKS